jgi:NAD-dependent deacetylase
MHWSRCWSCDDRRPMGETLERVRSGETDPPCLVCGGVLKSDTVSFGQSLVPEVIDAAMRAAQECDVLLAAGTSLSVFPAASVVPLARAAGAAVIIVNGQPTAMDDIADVVLTGSLSEILPAVTAVAETRPIR